MLHAKRALCALAISWAPATVWAGDDARSFTLGAYLPADVWLYLHEIHNPERNFICAHWDKVLSAAARSGLDTEIKRLIGDAMTDPGDRAEFDAKWDKLWKAVAAVPWFDKLGRREFAMGQRIALPMPTYMFLFRNDPAEAEEVTDSLVTLMETIASIAKGCAVVQDHRTGARVWSLCVGDVGPVFEMFSRGDVIGAAVGKGALDEMLALMERDSLRGSIIADPTFRHALATVDPPEDFVQFFRPTRMFKQIRGCLSTAFSKAKGDEDVRMVRDVVFKAFDHCDIIDYAIFTRRTQGRQEFFSGATRIAPGAKDKPLVRALTERKRFDQFDHFVPADATGFSVSSTIDLARVYDTLVDFLRTEIPNDGPRWLAAWEAFQKNLGFDIHRDLLDWLSGEYVYVSLPSLMPSQPCGVIMLRTKDPKLAWEKVSSGLQWVGARFPQVLVNPAPEVDAEGFLTLFHPVMMMMQVKPVAGMYEEWLVLGTKPQDVNQCLAVARGKAPGIRSNARFQSEGLTPNGPVNAASFADMSMMGEELSTVFGMVGAVGGMLPDKEELRPVRGMFTLMARLAPVVARIDFYSSRSSVCQFTGDGWQHRMVTTYKPAHSAPVGVAAETPTPPHSISEKNHDHRP